MRFRAPAVPVPTHLIAMRPVLLPTDQTLRRFNIFALAIDDACGMKTVGNRLHVNVFFVFVLFFFVFLPLLSFRLFLLLLLVC